MNNDDTLWLKIIVAIGALAAVVWTGGALAAALNGAPFKAGLADAAVAAVKLPSNLGHPARAWPPDARAGLPGAPLYWAAHALLLAPVGVASTLALRFARRRARDGLGVDRSARFARGGDLRRLKVRGPKAGRIIVGRAGPHGPLLATEPRTSICIVGPSSSGKTSHLCVPAILEMGKGDGALIAATVKGDLWRATCSRRDRIGDVKVYDPFCLAVAASASWSPLGACATASGAQKTARTLVEMHRKTGTSDDNFWNNSAYGLLWGTLLVANRSGKTMADVVHWITIHDRPRKDGHGNIARPGDLWPCLARLCGQEAVSGPKTRVEDLTADLRWAGYDDQQVLDALEAELDRVTPPEDPPAGPPAADPEVDVDLALARDALLGVWNDEDRTQSGVYSTARTFIEPWADPAILAAATTCDITPEWLLSGDNTLYIVAEAEDQERLQAIFYSLVRDLVSGAFSAATRNGGALPRHLVVLLDEAANICPLKQLPQWTATCPSHEISLITVWQDRSQQRDRYGIDGAETIWNNSHARLILPGIADRATSDISSQLGDEERLARSTTTEAGRGQRSINVRTETHALVDGSSLRQQQDGQALLVYRNLPPVRVILRPWFRNRHLRRLQKGRSMRAGLLERLLKEM